MKRWFECQPMGPDPSPGCKPHISAGAVQTSGSRVGSQAPPAPILVLGWAQGAGDVLLAQTLAELSRCSPPP